MFDVYSRARRVAVSGLDLRVCDHGPPEESTVLLLHGWPDTAHLWRHQVPRLVEAGHRVLVPDLRGFGGSDRPDAIAGYRLMRSVEDMLHLTEGLGAFHVVGHDWGAAVGWALALAHPDRLRSLTALSVGHPDAFRSAGLRQLRMSWYMFLFQFEEIAETFLSNDNWAGFRGLVADHPETPHWVETLSVPGALTSSLNWYRANSHPRQLVAPREPLPRCEVPVQGVWSTGDFALSESQMTASSLFVDSDWRYRRVEDSSHWLPLDAPELVSEAILDWIDLH